MRAALNTFSLLVLVASALATAGCNNMYGPCARNFDCAADLRCVDLGGDIGPICTKPCTIEKSRAGLPDVLDDDAFYEDGTVQNTTVSEADCLEGEATVLVENGNFDVSPAQPGDTIGVCRVSQEQLTNGNLGNDSQLTGWCAPL
jgi:hypothetical protein